MNFSIGDRIILLEPMNDPQPIPVNSKGTVTALTRFNDGFILSVDWESRRTLSLLWPEDKFEKISET